MFCPTCGRDSRGVNIDDTDGSLCDAIEIVLSLARENIITEQQAGENGIEDERQRQVDACDHLEDFAVNFLGED